MKASSGSKSGISRSSGGKRRLLAGTGGAALALALVLPSAAWAEDYTASNDAELRQAILDANADGDPSSTITLTGNIAVIGNLPESTKPLIINTGAFSTNGLALTGVVTVNGTLNGNDDLAGGNSQAGLSLVAVGGVPTTVTNNATVTGGDGNSGNASGAIVQNNGNLINNGSITGGSSGGPASLAGARGIQVSGNATVVNNGLIQGGVGLGVAGGTGAYIGVGLNTVQTFTNNATGIVRGGNGTGGALGGVGIELRTSTVPIVNHGLIEGGNGAAAITGTTLPVNIVNNGIIRAGTGGTVAMDFSSAQLVLLELQAGSSITGLVIANAAAPFAQTLQLGGTVDASFDMSSVGAAAQYRNFTRFTKTGTSAWTLTGNTSGMPTGAWGIQQGTLIFDDTATGQTASFLGTGALIFQQDGALSVGSLNGDISVLQRGPGTTTLQSQQAYSGNVTLTGGTLSIGAESALGSGAFTIDGGTLQWTGGTGSIARTINWGANGNGFEVIAGSSLTLSQGLTGSGALTKSGAGSLTLAGDNSYSGITTIAAGTLIVGSGTTGSLSGDIVNNAALIFNRSDNYTYAGAITGTGTLAKGIGAGPLTLTGQSNYGGTTTINGGELRVAAGGTVVSGGATSFSNNNGTFTVDGVGSAFTTTNINAAGGSSRIFAINVTNGGLLRTTTGDLVLRVAQLLPSATNRADLTVDGTGSLLDVAGGLLIGNVSATANGNLTITGGGAVRTGNLSTIGVATGNTRQLPTVTITGAGSNWTSASSLAMSNGSFTLAQGGTASFTSATFGTAAAGATLIVSGADSRLTTTVGDLVIGSGTGSGTLTLSDGGSLDIAGALVLADSATATGVINIGGAEGQASTAVGTLDATTISLGSTTSRINFNHTDPAFTIAAAIGGSGALHHYAGTTILSGVNSYSGGTFLNGGTLSVASNNSLGDGGSALNFNGGTLRWTGGTFTNTRTINWGANGGGFDIANAATVFTVTQTLAGGGPLTKYGDGILVLAADNSYTGGTTVAGGILQLGATGNTGSVTGDILNNGTVRFQRVDNHSYAGSITGSGSLIQQSGVLNLTGNSNYGGNTSINLSQLRVTAGNTVTSGGALGISQGGLTVSGSGSTFEASSVVAQSGNPAASITVENGGVLRATTGGLILRKQSPVGAGVASLSVSGAGSLVDLAGALEAGAANATSTVTVSISDGAALQSAGANLVGFTGGNNTGPVVTITGAGANWTGAGTLAMTNGSFSLLNAGTASFTGATFGSVSAARQATLLVSGAGSRLTTTASDLVIGSGAGTGVLTLADGGTVDIAGSLVLGDATTATGILNIGGAEGQAAAAVGTLDVAAISLGSATSRINFNHTDPGFTFAGAITGSGALNQRAGTTILTGASTYTGATNVAGGELQLASGGQINGTASLSLTRGQLTVDGAGSQFATAGTSVIGTTTGGTLTIRNGGSAAFGALNIADASGSSGTINVIGAGSQLTSTGIFSTGRLGTATINILDGGWMTTTTASTLIGGQFTTNAQALVTISGAGSAWDVTNALNARRGTITIADGGRMTAGTAVLGFHPGVGLAAPSFAMTVTGANSRFEAGTLTIANSAANGTTGALTIAEGGTVAVGGGTGTLAMGPGVSTLNLGAGGGAGTLEAALVTTSATSTINFNHSDTGYEFASGISGTGVVNHLAGDTNLTGDSSSYTGTANVSGGTLRVNGTLGGATSIVNVLTGGRLGGAGTIGGSVNVADGVLAAGNSPGTLTIAGDLTLAAASLLDFEFGQSNVVGGPLNDLIEVGGNLTLDGTIDVTVTPGGSFDVGVYRVINYAGSLNDQGMVLGTTPPGSIAAIQTSVANQVNLVNFAGADVNFWDGGGTGGDGVVSGGDGVWNATGGNTNWTVVDGLINTAYPDSAFAIFMAAPGTVTVDTGPGAVNASGMQFASNGYTITGGAIGLTGAQSIIRVGDGTAAGAGFTATIEADLTGAGDLVKTDLGTLVLTGANSFAGEGNVKSGGLRLADGGSLSNAQGIVGDGAGEQAVVTVIGTDGAGNASTWTNNGYLRVGRRGTGTLNILDGGAVNVTDIVYVGDDVGSQGTVTVSGVDANGNASTWTNARDLVIGEFGNGTLNITGGGQVSNESGWIGSNGGAVGTVTVSGTDGNGNASTWTSSGDLIVGYSGSGTLNIAAGGRVTSTSGLIGSNTGGTGQVLVTGVGSSWQNSGRINVGLFSTGTLRIENGATVSSNDAIVGASAQGNAVVTGAGSTWTNAQQLNVGSFGNGTLRIEDGGSVISNQGYVGANATGIVTVTGAGSNWQVGPFTLTVGNDGSGTLAIENGGRVLAEGGVYLGSGAASSGTLTLTGTAANRAVLETAGFVGAAGTVSVSIDGGLLRATADNGFFFNGFDTRDLTLGANGVLIDTDGHDIGIAPRFVGAGDLIKDGAGTLILSGANAYSGATTVNAGTLLVDGDQSASTGLTTIAAAATLGGSGTIGGSVDMSAGGTLAAGTNGAGTLAINGGLVLGGGSLLAFEFGQANTVGGALNDLVNVTGNLTLDGTIDVSVAAGGAFDIGLYRVFNYGGALTNNGLDVGALPAGGAAFVQTAIGGQVNLINTGGQTLNFWDGAVGPKFDNVVNGGSGVWQNSTGNDNWTDLSGAVNAGFTDDAVAIFAGNSGTVTVDNSLGAVSVGGMQFATGGYVITGGAVALADPQSVIRVGDGTVAGAGFVATISSVLTGAAQLVKTDAGTLVLAGANTYGGGTRINGGTLRISSDANLGGAAGGLALDTGTLHTTATLASARAIDLIGAGTFLTDIGTTLTANGTVSGAGSLTKSGAGTLILSGVNTYQGGTAINGGVLQVASDANLGDAAGGISLDGSTLRIAGDFTSNRDVVLAGASIVTTTVGADWVLAGDTSGSGSLLINTSNTVTLAGNAAHSGGTTVTGAGSLQIGNGGTTGSITGDIVNDANVIFRRSDAYSYDGVITGSGSVTHSGGGTLSLTADSSWAGGTLVTEGGTLRVASGNTISSAGQTTMSRGGTLTVSGLGTTWETGVVNINSAESATSLNVENGGVVRAGGLTLRSSPGVVTTANLNIAGNGSLVDLTGALTASASPVAVAHIAISGGGALRSSGANVIGGAAGNNAPSSVTITGAGSNWTSTGTLAMSNGSFSLLAGGGASFVSATIGTADEGADMLVSGANSIFATTGDLVLGNGATGVGTVTLADGGRLSVGGAFTLANAVGSTGTLNIGGGGPAAAAGFLDGAIAFGAGAGTLNFNHTETGYDFANTISGVGNIHHIAGVTRLAGDSSAFGGGTAISGGVLLVNGTLGNATSVLNVLGGGTLGGTGTIGGNVFVGGGGILAPGNSPGTLTINGNLGFSPNAVLNFELGQANVVGGALNDLINVGGDLTLDGTLNVTVPAGGSFGLGIYRLINYGGALTNNGLTVGSLPPGGTAFVQTGIIGQVNLINTGGQTLNFWDGLAGPKFDNVINGGSGTWQNSSGNDNWTDASGAVNAAFSDNAIAIFAGAAGTVTVDDSLGAVSAGGMQFATHGYVITGDAVTLTGPQATIRVGDGSAGSAGHTATIVSELTGASQLVKTDLGTLVLLGTNSYSGGTRIEAGTLRLGNGGATGSITGDIVNNGALMVNRSGTITLDGVISGSGSLTKGGSGTLILAGTNSYAGGTIVNGGTVRISSDANLGDVAGVLSLQGGTLQADASFTSARDILVGSPNSNRIDTQGFDVTLTGTIGNGANNQAGNFLDKIGSGTLTLTGANIYANRTVISGGTLALAGAGRAGVGNIIVGAGAVFDISQTNTGARVIQLNSGPAGTIALGSKMLTLGLDNSFSDWSGTITDGGIAGGTGGSVVIAGFGGAVRYFEANSYTGGTTILSGSFELVGNGSLYSGGAVTVNGGAVFSIVGLAGTGTTIGNLSGAGSVALGDKSLTFGTGSDTLFSGAINGNGGALVKSGAGTFTVTGAAFHTGGTTISAGTLQIGGGGTAGSIAGDIVDNGTLAFNRSNALTVNGTISGTGAVNQIGTGTTILTGANSYTGATTVSGGTLRINGDQSAATGLTNVLNGGTLGGTGTIGGSVNIADGGMLAPGNSPGTLTIAGNLALSGGSLLAFEFGQANVTGGALNDLIDVGGDLTLDGTIDVTQSAGGSFGPGVFRIINYGGTLTNNGLAIGTMPAGSQAFVQTVVPGQVNLVNTAGLTLNFWDGAAGPKNDGAIQGGTGVWRADGAENNWTEASGAINADYAQDSFAIFSGTGATVTVDNGNGNVRAAGIQFTVDGYTLNGGPLELTGTDAFVRVGDGGADDAAITATIASVLTGSARLVKDMGGTLVLTAANSYTGGTAINGGTLRVSSDANLGDATGGLSFNGGTLDITTTFGSNRAVNLAGTGTFLTQGTELILRGLVSGAGALVKDGNGALTLTADNGYTGGTTINAGLLLLGEGGTTGGILGNVVNNGRFAVNRSDTYTLTGTISGSGDVLNTGTGTTILTAANSYTGVTQVSTGTLLINGDQSAATGITTVRAIATLGGTGIIGGDVLLGNGTLAPGAGGAGTLTINGNLSMGTGARLAYDFGAANAVGSPLNDAVNVGGNLTLDGTLNVTVTPGGAFDIGLYRVLNYGGTLTDNGLTIGTMPAGADVFVQTSVANQVNLVNTGGATLNFWDGSAGANKFNNAVDGGSGMWRAALDDSWTDATGAVNAPYDNGAFAVFAGTGGTVTIDNSLGAVTASGLQFAANGYRIQGGALTLTGPQSVIRVGDGTVGGSAYTVTIDAEITGNTQLVKTDLGRLELTGANSYTGGTAINGGTARITSDTNLGDAAGGLSFNGGTLSTGADLSSARAVTLAGQGVFTTDAGTTLTLTGSLNGAGLLGKTGTGTLVLAGTGGHTGGTEIVQGMLLVNGNYAAATGAMTIGGAATLGGTGTIGGDVNLAGTLTPGAGGTGTLTINGDLTISQSATLAYEFGQANVAGGALNDLVNIGGDLTLDGTINVTVPAGGNFSAGIYRVFNYGGTLTNNGLTLGTLPAGSNVGVQTAIAGQVNLVNFAGLSLSFWDGAAGPKNNGVINGGNGVWQSSGGNDNWTEAAGLVNAGYTDGAFAVFGGTAGTVTVDNSLGQVTAGGMQFAVNGYTVTGGGIALSGGQATIRVGDGSVAGAGYTATISAALSGASELVKTDAGTLVLTGANSYTGGTRIMGGTVQIASDANLGAAAGGLTFDGGTLAATATLTSTREINLAGAGTLSTANGITVTLTGAFAGTGAFTKEGGGTLLLTGNGGGYTGATRITAGTLAVTGTFGGAVDVRTGTRLEGTGAVGAVTNAGTVAPGRDGFGTLTVNGSYTGSNGILEIDAELNGDDSRADRLMVNGATAGSTVIKVTEHGGLGAATVDGIKIVDVTGTSSGVFTLDSGDYLFEGAPALIAGAYGYRLYKNGVTNPADGDWYLRSALLVPNNPDTPQVPLYQPGVPVYEAYGQTLAALSQFGTMQERIGNRQWADGNARSFGIWGRSESKRMRPEAVRSTSLTDANVDSWKIELGADQVLSERADGASLVLGVLGSYGEASASVASPYGNGSIKTQGYSAGATLTWFGPKGFYVDGRAQVSWFDSKLTSAVLGKLVEDNKGTGQSYSIEIGKRAPIGGSLSVTPQIQTVYSTVGFDGFTDPNGAAVSSKLGDSLKTRWGLSLDRQDARSHLYGVVNLSYEWLDGTVTDVSGTPIARENHRLWGELGIGGSLMLGSRVTLYSEVSADTAINDFGKSYRLKGVAALRLAF